MNSDNFNKVIVRFVHETYITEKTNRYRHHIVINIIRKLFKNFTNIHQPNY